MISLKMCSSRTRVAGLALIFFAVQTVDSARLAPPIVKTNPRKRLVGVRSDWLAMGQHVIHIDVENVRGRSGFLLGHDAMMPLIAEWVKAHHLQGRVVLQIDHGEKHEGFYHHRYGFGVVFAGPFQKTDDVIERDMAYFEKKYGAPATVVSADYGIKLRGQKEGGSKRKYTFVQPAMFIETLVDVALEASMNSPSGITEKDERMLNILREEALRIEMKSVEIKMERARGKSWFWRNSKTYAKLERSRQRLLDTADDTSERGGLEQVEPDEPRKRKKGYSADLTPTDIEALKEGLDALREAGIKFGKFTGSKREFMGKRQIMAEELRLALRNSTEDERVVERLRQSLATNVAVHGKAAQEAAAALAEDAETLEFTEEEWQASEALQRKLAVVHYVPWPAEAYVEWLNRQVAQADKKGLSASMYGFGAKARGRVLHEADALNKKARESLQSTEVPIAPESPAKPNRTELMQNALERARLKASGLSDKGEEEDDGESPRVTEHLKAHDTGSISKSELARKNELALEAYIKERAKEREQEDNAEIIPTALFDSRQEQLSSAQKLARPAPAIFDATRLTLTPEHSTASNRTLLIDKAFEKAQRRQAAKAREQLRRAGKGTR